MAVFRNLVLCGAAVCTSVLAAVPGDADLSLPVTPRKGGLRYRSNMTSRNRSNSPARDDGNIKSTSASPIGGDLRKIPSFQTESTEAPGSNPNLSGMDDGKVVSFVDNSDDSNSEPGSSSRAAPRKTEEHFESLAKNAEPEEPSRRGFLSCLSCKRRQVEPARELTAQEREAARRETADMWRGMATLGVLSAGVQGLAMAAFSGFPGTAGQQPQ
ncbi:unnamed protein product [Amoebophrya sp. A120]|nr:unnamed protein product [Amoebophrya sp. A120]|eukprot:GSA120T00018815001.1